MILWELSQVAQSPGIDTHCIDTQRIAKVISASMLLAAYTKRQTFKANTQTRNLQQINPSALFPIVVTLIVLFRFYRTASCLARQSRCSTDNIVACFTVGLGLLIVRLAVFFRFEQVVGGRLNRGRRSYRCWLLGRSLFAVGFVFRIIVPADVVLRSCSYFYVSVVSLYKLTSFNIPLRRSRRLDSAVSMPWRRK